MIRPTVRYDTLPNQVGELLRSASLATTATVPVSSKASLVFTTSHVGLDLHSGRLINDTIEHEFEAIFSCLDAALRHAGASSGLRQAYKFVSYLTRVEDEAVMQSVFKRMFPGHAPTWCLALVQQINIPGMRAEITAEGAIFHPGLWEKICLNSRRIVHMSTKTNQSGIHQTRTLKLRSDGDNPAIIATPMVKPEAF